MATNNITTSRYIILPILLGFFIMGFVDAVGIATNYVKEDFNLSDSIANLLPMMVFLWFIICSIPTGILMGKIGRRNTVLIAFGMTVVAMLLPLFCYKFANILLAFALLGIGNALLQVSLNPMVAQTVSPDRTASILTLGQFMKAVSSFLGPIIAGLAASCLGDWRWIFPIYAITTVIVGVWMWLSVPGKEINQAEHASLRSALSLFGNRTILMLFIGILLIVGIDVGLNTTIPKLLVERTELPLVKAGLGSSLYFASRTVGSFLGAFLLVRISGKEFLKWSMLLSCIAFIVLLSIPNLQVMLVMITLVGLACSNVFSIIFSYALQHLPRRANEISALMIMGVSGGALVTPLMGILSDAFGQAGGLLLLLPCMLYLGWISLKMR